MKTKTCETCQLNKPVDEFYFHPSLKDQLHRHCKKCHNEKMRVIREIKKTAPPKPTLCQCCEKPTTVFHLDHDHETNNFRGWLCAHCNQGIGKLGDNLQGVLKAVNYLSTNNGSKIKNSTGSN